MNEPLHSDRPPAAVDKLTHSNCIDVQEIPKEMEEGYKLLVSVCVSFLAGVLLILLIIVIAAVVLWKCGVRLEKRAKESNQSDTVRCEIPEPQPSSESGQWTVTVSEPPNASATSPDSGNRVRTSSGRRSSRVMTSFRRRSRKAISVPLTHLRSGYRKARCVSLGTHLDGCQKLSALVNCIEPYLGTRPGSLWTRISSDESIVFENNDCFILIPRNRQKTTTHCQSCRQKEPNLPQNQFSEPNVTASQHESRINRQCPPKPPMTDSTVSARTKHMQEEIHARHVSRHCDKQGTSATGDAPLFGHTSDSRSTGGDGKYQAIETSSDDLSMNSDLESVATQKAAGSDTCDQSMKRKPMNIDPCPFVGHAKTATTKPFIFGSSYNGHFPSKLAHAG